MIDTQKPASPFLEGLTQTVVCSSIWWTCGHHTMTAGDAPRYCPVCTGQTDVLLLEDGTMSAKPTAEELRPPVEHAGKELHWIQAEGDDPDIGAWDTSWPGQPRWRIFDSEASAVTGQEMAARGYRHLGPAEWRDPCDDHGYGPLIDALTADGLKWQEACEAVKFRESAANDRIAELEAENAILRGHPLYTITHEGMTLEQIEEAVRPPGCEVVSKEWRRQTEAERTDLAHFHRAVWERDRAVARVAELEAQVKGGVAALDSVCKADNRTFAAYQARIEELETENARLNAYIGKITDDNTALGAKIERLEDERDGWIDVPADVRRKAVRRDPPAVGRAPLPRRAMR